MEENIFWNELERIKTKMLGARDYEKEMIPLMEELQQLLSSNTVVTKQYKNHKRIINALESVYIIESVPSIEENIVYKDEMSSDEKANYIAQRMRQLLLDPEKNNRGIDYDLSADNLRGECRNTTKLLLEECTELNTQTIMRRGSRNPIIADGFDTKFDLGITENDNHSFGIVEIDGKKYIIDCTYRQFFSVTKNIEFNEFGRVRDAGRYMLADEQRKKFAEQLLKYGYIEATPENLKLYLDGFVLADRKSKESDRTDITPEEYQQKIADVNWERVKNDDMSENPFFNVDAEQYRTVLDSFESFDKIKGLTEEQKAALERMKKEGIRTFGDLEEILNLMPILGNIVENQSKVRIDTKNEVLNNLEGLFDTILYEYTSAEGDMSDIDRVTLYNERIIKLKSKFAVYANLTQDFKKTERYAEMKRFLDEIPVFEEYKYDEKVNEFINQQKEKRVMQTNKAKLEEYMSERKGKSEIRITSSDIAIVDKESELIPREIEKAKIVMQLCIGEIDEKSL